MARDFKILDVTPTSITIGGTAVNRVDFSDQGAV